jgi:hypothetical protein
VLTITAVDPGRPTGTLVMGVTTTRIVIMKDERCHLPRRQP